MVIGLIANDVGWGPVLRVSVVFPAAALVLLLWLLPETRGRELEATATIAGPRSEAP
jgi:putative MFS transporter